MELMIKLNKLKNLSKLINCYKWKLINLKNQKIKLNQVVAKN